MSVVCTVQSRSTPAHRFSVLGELQESILQIRLVVLFFLPSASMEVAQFGPSLAPKNALSIGEAIGSVFRFSSKMMNRALVSILVLLFGSTAVGQQPKAITNSIGMKLVLIHAGSFSMGAPEEEIGRQNEETPHEVTISKSYYLGACEVTQDQYESVMGNNPSAFKGAKNPVEMVSWYDAVSFCKKLSEMPEERATGREYRLPTEAEWEYACRATSSAAYSFGDAADELSEYVWCGEHLGSKPHPVGEKKANRWGLFDMHGNVWEWCQDWYGVYPSGAATDPSGPNEGSSRVLRGGCWINDAGSCLSAYRSRNSPSDRSNGVGFRVALSPSVKSPEANIDKK